MNDDVHMKMIDNRYKLRGICKEYSIYLYKFWYINNGLSNPIGIDVTSLIERYISDYKDWIDDAESNVTAQ